MKVGFIGTGSMGSMLIESFLQSGALRPQEIIASNRTNSKIERLAEQYKGLSVAQSNTEVVLHSQIVFICVKPAEFIYVITEIKAVALPSQIIISITSPIKIAFLEQQLTSKIAKIIPSITNFVLSGATLCIYGERMQLEDMLQVERLLSYISEPVRVKEQFTRITSDISSCGPAFFAFLLQKFIDAAVEETGIAYTEANRLACEMLLGTGKLLTIGGITPEQLQKRVSVPGGITEAGLRSLEKELVGVFNQLIRITHAKFDEDVEKVNLQQN
jgi:competence protein ComER